MLGTDSQQFRSFEANSDYNKYRESTNNAWFTQLDKCANFLFDFAILTVVDPIIMKALKTIQ